MAIFLHEDEIKQLITLSEAIDAVEAVHKAHALGEAVDIPRERTRLPKTMMHMLQGGVPSLNIIGYKVYTTNRGGARFLLHAYEADTGTLQAVMDADWLGMLRTGAVAGVAAKWLARSEASVMGVFGAGWQAQSQIEAVCAVRPIREVRVFSRTPEKRRAFCERMSARLGLAVVEAEDARGAVSGCQIVTTITNASSPLFESDWLEAGAHITAAGSNALIRRELDEKTVYKANLVCVDARVTAVREAGDLLPLLEKGRLHAGRLVELGEIVAGFRQGRTAPEQITLFESQGMAIQDLAVAACVMKRAKEQGAGVPLPY